MVDQGVKEITELIENFYNDGKTAFVFTADHGMSDWGSHGDGHPDNTRTPLITWGSGIAKPVITEPKAPGHNELSADWDLDHIQRHDVAQADVAALMAYLAGLEFPVNSVGELPLEYLAAGPKEKAEAALKNAQGVLEMYRVKEEQKQKNQLRYVPFPGLGDDEHSVEHRVNNIRGLIETHQYDDAIEASKELLHLGIQGLRYLQTYDWLFLRCLITAGYLGWIAFALTTVIDLHVLHGKYAAQRTSESNVLFLSVLTILYTSFIIGRSPATYYAYAVFPVAFWEEVYAKRKALWAGGKQLFAHINSVGGWIGVGLSGFASLAFIEALALGYTHREIFTGLYLCAAVWPLFYGGAFIKEHAALIATWAVACVGMSSFTLLPVVKVESIDQITYAGALMVLVGLIYLVFEKRILGKSAFKGDSTAPPSNALSRTLVGVQIGLIILSILVTRSSVQSLQAKQGLPLGNQMVGWLIFGKFINADFARDLMLISSSSITRHALPPPPAAK